MADEERKCSVNSATAASLFAMVLLLYDVIGTEDAGTKKAPTHVHGALITDVRYRYCHTPARALKKKSS
jgi:hypothetical protein